MSATPDPIADIYRALTHGRGRELVTDANADALIELAKQHGDVQTEYLLREWRSPCGDDGNMPDLSKAADTLPHFVAKDE